ncbi:MAG: class I tRNA ligase family protein [Bacteroidota bacterium]
MEYNFAEIEQTWKKYWNDQKVYKVNNPIGDAPAKPKCYVLDMFPYPSGAGLHVGHPLGYIASDIYARYKRLKGYNVLHPMGFDAFGLPAEQYAIETGQHPAVTTEKNIARYREQLDNIGFCYDWDREVRTSDPKYYKWTQWIFLQLFHSWYDRKENKARAVSELVKILEQEGNSNHRSPDNNTGSFDAAEWQGYDEKKKREIIMGYRLAYQGYAQVWWCEALGTVLANDEVVNGVSERGGHPVERKNMRQWFLRITEYADRLLTSLDNLDWSEAMKEMQRNWIGKSVGAEVEFDVVVDAPIEENGTVYPGHGTLGMKVFTTRPDTIFGVDFMVLAPEHELVDGITTTGQKQAVADYKQYVKTRSERERMSEVKQVTGAFTGAYALHPFTNREIPVWISEYVLAGYGTGAIMAVPSGDERDHAFAKHFNIPITNIFGDRYKGDKAYSDKTGTIENSDFLSGMTIAEAAVAAIEELEDMGGGEKKVNFRLRDAGFSRQRYWGEPFPINYVDDVPFAVDESPIPAFHQGEGGVDLLPVELPFVESYRPGPEGQGPLANIEDWVNTPAGMRETNTMPGYAGSSWYFLRYMDPHNDNEFADRKITDYWQQVDLYVGGTEHAVGHLLYSRMWTKALYDLGYIGFDEPFKKLLNQGMIQGTSYFAKMVHTINVTDGKENVRRFFVVSNANDKQYKNGHRFEHNQRLYEVVDKEEHDPFRLRNAHLHVDSKGRITKSNLNKIFELYYNEPDDRRIEHVRWDGALENGEEYIQANLEVEKMSKSKYNVVNPDDIVHEYGADTFRMYEMFLGPIDVSKPWDTKGIEGVHRFLKKLWRLYADEQKGWIVTDEPATEAELKGLHKTIKKIGEDIERFSFNTAVSQFMIFVNDLTGLNCHKRAVLEPLAILIAPFAPHIAEELWHKLGNETTVLDAPFPAFDQQHLTDKSIKYAVAVNGKTRVEMEFAADAAQSAIEQEVLGNDTIQKWLDGKPPKKIIYVSGKMVNVVV